MEPSELWERLENNDRFSSWHNHRAVVLHRSAKSYRVIWPGQKAMRRTTIYLKHIWDEQWITEKEYVVLTLQGHGNNY